MENEIMNFEDVEVVEGEIVNERSGIGTGTAMLIGAGLVFAVGAGIKAVKKGIAALKAKKEAKEAEKAKHNFCEPEDMADESK